VVLPKVEGEGVIERAGEVIRRHRPSGMKPLPMWAMIETCKGVLNVHSIAKHPLVHCLVFGSNDLTKDLRAKHTPQREPLLFSMSHCILAARAEHKRVMDGVHIELQDLEGLRLSCEQGRNLGFDGKTLIHPTQIDIANAAYSPTGEDVAAAHSIVVEQVLEEAREIGMIQ
jgi:citrate lyase beta subunit